LREAKARKFMMEEMGAAFTAEGVVTLAGSRLYTSMADTDEVIAEVRRAVDAGSTVKMVGTGHSFTAISAPEATMLRPGALTGVVGVDRNAMTVTARAGTQLKVLNAELERLGLSLHNMGDIAEQTLAGAISTGTHGTGARLPSVSAQVEAVRLVDGRGNVVELDGGDELRAARVSIGALGVTCFRPYPLDEVRAALLHARRIVVLEKAFAVGAGGIVGQNVRLALSDLPIRVFDVVAGLGGRPITRASLRRMLADARDDRLGRLTFLDLDRDRVERELARGRELRRPGPHAESILRDLGVIGAGPV
jgi:FAD/FMN-containing dehydrogenase